VGALFPYLIESQASPNSASVIQAYAFESLGAFVGSLVLNLLFFHWLNALQIMAVLLVLTICLTIWSSTRRKKYWVQCLVALGMGVLLFGYSHRIQKTLFHLSHPHYQLTVQKDTPYGNLKFVNYQDQSLVFLGGTILYLRPNQMESEFRTLLPVLASRHARNILWLGGDLFAGMPYFAAIRELQQITYVEIDPFLVKFQQDSIRRLRNGTHLPEISFFVGDFRQFLAQDTGTYDIICLNLPEPHTLYYSRYYSMEFYRLVRHRLASKGIFFFGIRSSENYLNQPLARYVQLLRQTLEQVFPETFILPGDNNYFFASPGRSLYHLPDTLLSHLQRTTLPVRYLNPTYLRYQFSAERIHSFQEQLNRVTPPAPNRDFNLQAYLYHSFVWGAINAPLMNRILYGLKQNRTAVSLLLLLLVVLIQLAGRKRLTFNRLNKLFFIGALSMVLEIVLLLEFEILFGNLYYQIAFVIGGFMLGLALGSQLTANHFAQNFLSLRKLFLMFALFTAGLYWPVLFGSTVLYYSVGNGLLQWVYFPLLIILIGMGTGAGFRLITWLHFQSGKVFSTGITYGIDLAGAVAGSFLFSVFLIPVLGIRGTLHLLLLLTLSLLISTRE
jgi:spermidine synthase